MKNIQVAFPIFCPIEFKIIFLAFLLKPLVGEPEIDWQEIFAFDNNGNREVLVSVSYMQGLTTTQENITTLELTVSKNHNSTKDIDILYSEYTQCCIDN